MTARTWHGHGNREAHRIAADHTTLRDLLEIDQCLDTELHVTTAQGRCVIMSIYKDDNGVIWLDVEQC